MGQGDQYVRGASRRHRPWHRPRAPASAAASSAWRASASSASSGPVRLPPTEPAANAPTRRFAVSRGQASCPIAAPSRWSPRSRRPGTRRSSAPVEVSSPPHGLLRAGTQLPTTRRAQSAMPRAGVQVITDWHPHPWRLDQQVSYSGAGAGDHDYGCVAASPGNPDLRRRFSRLLLLRFLLVTENPNTPQESTWLVPDLSGRPPAVAATVLLTESASPRPGQLWPHNKVSVSGGSPDF